MLLIRIGYVGYISGSFYLIYRNYIQSDFYTYTLPSYLSVLLRMYMCLQCNLCNWFEFVNIFLTIDFCTHRLIGLTILILGYQLCKISTNLVIIFNRFLCIFVGVVQIQLTNINFIFPLSLLLQLGVIQGGQQGLNPFRDSYLTTESSFESFWIWLSLS